MTIIVHKGEAIDNHYKFTGTMPKYISKSIQNISLNNLPILYLTLLSTYSLFFWDSLSLLPYS